tara:strand:+ start:28 stop:147 length:120 start_codon:yes stop_codon:yes gene_type:complete
MAVREAKNKVAMGKCTDSACQTSSLQIEGISGANNIINN